MPRSIRTGLAGIFLLAAVGQVDPLWPEESQGGSPPETADVPAETSGPSAEEPSNDTPFGETVDVTVVNVEVRVIDKDGNPVSGLTREDFQLYEDDRPVAITNFYEVEDGLRPARETASETTPAAPEESQMEPDRPLYLVVYVDNFNIRPHNRNRVFRSLRTFLQSQLEADDSVMLVSYDRTLKVQAPFSTDRDLLFAKLAELERYTGHAVTADADRRQVLREIEEAASETFATMAAETYAEATLSDVRFSIRALHDFVDQLAGVRGRRAILHVSDGLPMRPAESIFYTLERKYTTSSVHMRSLNYDATREFRSLAASASSAGVTFYTIDAAGLRPPSAIGVRTMTGVGGGALSESVYIRNHQEPLRHLAEETGGFAILNTNDVSEGLERLRQDLDHYYSLGYSPAGTISGRGHRIKVEVPGLKKVGVRYRKSYREETLADRMENETLATLRFGLDENVFGADLEFAEVRDRDDGYFDVIAWLQIPVSELTLVAAEGVHQGRLSLYVSALDEEGGVSDVANLSVPLELPSEDIDELAKLDFPYRLELRMRPGPHRVAVGIRDELGARTGYLSEEFVVRPPA